MLYKVGNVYLDPTKVADLRNSYGSIYMNGRTEIYRVKAGEDVEAVLEKFAKEINALLEAKGNVHENRARLSEGGQD